MFRIWAKIFKENRMLKDTVIENNNSTNRTRKVLDAIDAICKEFDLSSPLWLENNITEFKTHDKVRFYKDNFIDEIDFDYLELAVIEEDCMY